MRWRIGGSYYLQVWTVALCSILLCLFGLGQLGLGIWLAIYSNQFSAILTPPIIYIHYGYLGNGLITSTIGIFGCIGSLLRKRNCLFVYAVFLISSMICQSGVWAFIYVEHPKVSSELTYKIEDSPEIVEFINTQYECQLQNTTITENQLLQCSELVDHQVWLKLVPELALCGFTVCLEFVLLMMAILLNKLVKDACEEDIPISFDRSQRDLRNRHQTKNTDEEASTCTSTSTQFIFLSPKRDDTSIPSTPRSLYYQNPMVSGWSSPVTINATTTTL